jgi:signal transduction histidine kinase
VSGIRSFDPGDTDDLVFLNHDDPDLSAVEIAATAFANLLEGRTVQPLTPGQYLPLVALFGVAIGMVAFLLEPVAAALAVIVLGGAYLAFAYWRFVALGLWYPIMIPLFLQIPAAYTLAVIWKYLDAKKLELERAKELDALKSMLLSHVSHELKTPLTAIRAFVDNMTSGLTGELAGKQRDYLRRIRSNTDRLTRMIANLLDLSRIEAGTERLQLAPVRVCEVIRESASQLRLMADARGVALEVACDDSGLRAMLDADKFTQILTNLIENAIKFTAPGGRIDVVARRLDRERFEVSVIDNGEGIRPECLGRLFEPFYQPDHEGPRPELHESGLGLGLSIVKHLVDLHAGAITVRSEPGKGSEFRVVLPALG